MMGTAELSEGAYSGAAHQPTSRSGKGFITGFCPAAIAAARLAEAFATTDAERLVVERNCVGRLFVCLPDAARRPDRIGVYGRDVTLQQLVDDLAGVAPSAERSRPRAPRARAPLAPLPGDIVTAHRAALKAHARWPAGRLVQLLEPEVACL